MIARPRCILLALAGMIFLSGIHNNVLYAQEADSVRAFVPPGYELSRYREDYSYLKDPSLRQDFFDPIKYIPLSKHSVLSFGGALRVRYEYQDNANFGLGPQDQDGFFLSRVSMHGDLHVSPYLRGFVDLKSALITGRTGGARILDEDQLDVHQAFGEIIPWSSPVGMALIRVGRQELSYGRERLISLRDGPNVRQSFDAILASLTTGRYQAELLAARPVTTEAGVFDNGRFAQEEWMWGGRLLRLVRPGSPGWVVFYLGQEREQAPFAQATDREVRHSIGGRFWTQPYQSYTYDLQAVYQFGRFGTGAISAWLLAAEGTYTIAGVPLRPTLGFTAHAGSGDRDPENPDLQTFAAPYPRNFYFGSLALVGSFMNFYHIKPEVRFSLGRRANVSTGWEFFWRQQTGDAVYNAGKFPIRPLDQQAERFIGSQPNVTFFMQADRHIQLLARYMGFVSGAYLRDTGPAETVHQVLLQVQYTF